MHVRIIATGLLAVVGCRTTADVSAISSGATSTGASHGSESSTAGTSSEGGAATSTGHADSSSSGPPLIYDVGAGTGDSTGGPPIDCAALDPNVVLPCEQESPPDSFDPDVQWEFFGADGYSEVITTPLVVNLTDDNDDGEIDMCDVPDVVVVAYSRSSGDGRIVVLSGADGSVHFTIPVDVDPSLTPAVGDIDGDGLVEIVAATGNTLWPMPVAGNLVAFEHDGSGPTWTSAAPSGPIGFSGPALADLDADGDVEILLGDGVYDHLGNLLWSHDESPLLNVGSLATAADLDGDGALEVVHGRNAYFADGSVFYSTDLEPGFPHVADFVGDATPEIIVMNLSGISMVETDGTVVWRDHRPTGDSAGPTAWIKPGTVHDFDGDGSAEFATGSRNHYAVYEIDVAGPTILWEAPVLDFTGSAGGTAFDFDGNGIAEAMYADETQLFVFDGAGVPLFTTPRVSDTGTEYPVVADIDNDGAAEILVVSNLGPVGSATVVAIRDVEERWIQARRIWNQHTYHVTNVREDGTIPQHETPSWTQLNTFRTNSQIEGGAVCQPPG